MRGLAAAIAIALVLAGPAQAASGARQRTIAALNAVIVDLSKSDPHRAIADLGVAETQWLKFRANHPDPSSIPVVDDTVLEGTGEAAHAMRQGDFPKAIKVIKEILKKLTNPNTPPPYNWPASW